MPEGRRFPRGSYAAASVTLAGVARPEYYGNPAGLTQDIDVVRAIYAAFAVRDLEGALDFVDPECEIHVEGTARAAGRQGPYVGHDGCAVLRRRRGRLAPSSRSTRTTSASSRARWS